jgi:molecular chaperone GrpE
MQEMTKKKKVHPEKIKQNIINDRIDIKDIRSQYTDDSKDNNEVDIENALLKEDKTNSMKIDTDIPAEPDKDVKQENSVEEKLAEMQDRYLRLSAEFDNYRKRTLREKIELTKNAGENILLSIIPVMDDFERAMKLMETASDCVAMKSGIDLIYNKFFEFLKQNGIKEIESLNKDFDVDLHEAVTKVSVSDKYLKGKVVDVVAKGYWLHDKVIRHSKVIVGE